MKIFMLALRSFVGFVWEQRRGWKRSIFKLGRGFVHCRIGSHGRFYGKLRNGFLSLSIKTSAPVPFLWEVRSLPAITRLLAVLM